MRWPFMRRPAPDDRLQVAKDRAEDQLQQAREQGPRVEEAVRQAQGVLQRSGRFTREVDRVLRLRGV